MIPLRVVLQTEPWKRNCDFCGRPYNMNAREISRIYVSKKVDLSDLESKDFIASPDFCELCITQIIRFIERKNKLTFSVNGNRIIQSIVKVMSNQFTK